MKLHMRLEVILIIIIVLVTVGIVLIGCGDIGNRQLITNTNLNLVEYADDGTPIFVADQFGNMISVDNAADELLWKRGLIRINGKVEEI